VKLKDIDQQLASDSDLASKNVILPGEVVIGVFSGLNDQGEVLVDYPDNPSKNLLTAISTVALNQGQSGRQVAMLFAEGNPEKPVIVGLIHNALYEMIENFEIMPAESEMTEENHNNLAGAKTANNDNVYLDGKRVVLEGHEEVVFKCGDASITLTKAGKILIRGKYLLTRSTAVNRIMGGSVQVN
jgi:hypothetical protein